MKLKPHLERPVGPPDGPAEPDFTVTEADVDEAIEACSGDARATVRALLVALQFMERALEEARQEAAWGYVTARPSRRMRDGQAEG